MLVPQLAPQTVMPVFPTPVRWTLRALAWIAFAASAYLAWHAVTGAHVAGCGTSGASGCDMVLSSPWSKWLGVPVAVPGLACYATLATLSIFLGRTNPHVERWLTTAFVTLAALAAVASIWFLALQAFAIGHLCRYCIVADLCGIAMGVLAVGFTWRWLQATRYLRRSRTAASGLMALRTTLPAGSAPVPGARTAAAAGSQPAPSLALALGVAGAVATLLIAGQILLPSKSFEMQKVALADSIDMNGDTAGGATAIEPAESGSSDNEPSNEPAENQPAASRPVESPSAEANERVAMRVPVDVEGNHPAADENAAGAEPNAQAANETKSADVPNAETAPSEEPEAGSANVEPARSRLVKFLGGKLTLDVYKHPVIGSPEAPHVIIEMVSYNCKHCRKTHPLVKKALSRYGNQVAVILLVVPMERECNKLITNSAASHRGACATARTTLALAALRPTAFAKFHDWLMTGEDEPPGIPAIIARAYSLVDSQRLREVSESEPVKKQIESYVNLFGALQRQNAGKKAFGLPIQILGDHVMSGSVEKPDELYKAWEKHLGVKPR